MPDGFSFEQLRICAEREVAQRERVYSRLVEQKKWTQERADREIAMMRAIAAHLKTQEQEGLF